MSYEFFTKPIPLNKDAIAFECKIHKDDEEDGEMNIIINRYGDYSGSSYNVDKSIINDFIIHCLSRAEVVFGKFDKEQES